MDYEEFARISQDLGGGACGREMWPVIEQTYMTCEITKNVLAYVYWNKTGYYEQLEYHIKKYLELKNQFYRIGRNPVLQSTAWILDGMSTEYATIVELVNKCNYLFDNRPAKFRKAV